MCEDLNSVFTPQQHKALLALLQQHESMVLGPPSHIVNQITTYPPQTHPTSGINHYVCSFPHQKPTSDTRAIDHIYHSLSHFQCFKQIRPISVNLPDVSQIIATIAGSVFFPANLFITNVLYIPQCSFNLVSISKLTSNLKFTDNGYEIQETHALRTIGVARLRNGLYTLDSHEVQVCNVSSDLNSCSPDFNLWHFRLGHPSYARLLAMKQTHPYIISVDNKTPCDVCHFTKQKRLPFPSSHTKSVHCFDLLHVDTWGASSSSFCFWL